MQKMQNKANLRQSNTKLCGAAMKAVSAAIINKQLSIINYHAPPSLIDNGVNKAEEEGFEPPVPYGTTVFKTVTLSHSVTPPAKTPSSPVFSAENTQFIVQSQIFQEISPPDRFHTSPPRQRLDKDGISRDNTNVVFKAIPGRTAGENIYQTKRRLLQRAEV